MPVFPLVGSTISMPGFNTPRFSASHTIAAPMRHFTEYAGFLPSIFASTVALAPSVTRFSLIRGVLPILSELSAKTFAMMKPQWSEFAVSGQPEQYKSAQPKTRTVTVFAPDCYLVQVITVQSRVCYNQRQNEYEHAPPHPPRAWSCFLSLGHCRSTCGSVPEPRSLPSPGHFLL